MSSTPKPIPPEALESDPRFPSGPWRGFFLQREIPPGRHAMELELTFFKGRIRGEGRDRIGEFFISGRYHLDDGRCTWTKTYSGKHRVDYQGYNEGKGIWGGWSIKPTWKGGFHVWPVGLGLDSPEGLATAQDVPREVEEPAAELVGAGAGEGESEKSFEGGS